MKFKRNDRLFYNRDGVKKVFIPSDPKNVKQGDLYRYLQNIELEIDKGLFAKHELLLLKEEAFYRKFLNKTERPFFLYHFLPLWENTINIVFQDNPHPKIIELGCGTGTSSLLFAFLGAEVIGIDLNPDLIQMCIKRKEFYERYFKPIKVDFYQGNSINFTFEAYAPVDVFFSLFAFNLMKPPDVLLSRLISPLKHGGIIIIIDGNSISLYNCLIPSRRRAGIFSPAMIKKRLEALGCKVLLTETHCVIPPFIFRISGLRKAALKIEDGMRFLSLHKFFGVSFTMVAKKII